MMSASPCRDPRPRLAADGSARRRARSCPPDREERDHLGPHAVAVGLLCLDHVDVGDLLVASKGGAAEKGSRVGNLVLSMA